jgi:hypothetical protein
MLIERSNPVGIDKIISSLQTRMYAILADKWTGIYNSYPRCYRNQSSKNDFVAELFDGKDYKEVYFDDSASAVSFFGTGQTTVSDDDMTTTDVHLVFMVNLKKIKGTEIVRLDEEAKLDVQTIIATIGRTFGFVLKRVGTGLDYCLKEYPGSRQSDGLMFRDQHPLFCFRFDMQANYQPTLCNC